MLDRTALVSALEGGGRRTAEAIRALTAKQLRRRQAEGDWTGLQTVAHIAAIEWTYPRLIDLAKSEEAAAGGTAATPDFDIDAYNQRLVAKRADASIDDLITEFERNRAATIEAVARVDNDLLQRRIRTVGGIEGTLGSVLNYVCVVHVDSHLKEISDGD
jgi:uncharacterized damage-inducible protein DinB